MIVTIVKPTTGETFRQQIHIGSKFLVGRRLMLVELENWEEVRELFSEKGVRWAKDCLIPAMLTKTQQEFYDQAPSNP